MITDDDVRRLGSGRWLVPMLAVLLEQDGARFTVLLSQLGSARDSLVRTLAEAAGSGWVMRNPGYGHPLRPEYVLSERGRVVAAACVRMMAVRQRCGLEPGALPRWGLPVLWRTRNDWVRFTDLLTSLAPVTPRALSLNLKQMIQGDILSRRVEPSFPPASLYGLTPSGRELLRCLQAGQ